MIINLEIESVHDAFGNDRVFEVQRILTKYVPEIKTKDYINLYDLNGNKVGFIQDTEY